MISIESFRRLFIICLYFLDFILLSNLATCKISTAFVLGRREDLSQPAGRCLCVYLNIFFHFAGKLYKSKVCFTKHLWEHSVYWDLFDALKNQERVLSIQAAIILSQPYLEFLLVTSPTSTEKKKEDPKPNSIFRKNATRKRQRESSTCSVDF